MFKRRIRYEADAGASGGGTPAPAEVKIPEAVLERITKDATEKAVAAANAEAAKSTQKIVSALTGQTAPSADDRVMDTFLKNPLGTLNKVADAAREQALEEMRAERKAEKKADAETAKKAAAKDAEQAREATELWKRRPDIKATPENKELLNRYYMTTDADLPEKERIDTAVKEYDAFMTKLDGKTSEDRVKAVADLSIGSGGSKEAKPAVTTAMMRSELLAKQRESQAKKRGGAQNISQVKLTSLG